MKTLYIHGLDSEPKPEKIELIKQHSEVEALHLDYRKNEDSYQVLSKVIKSKNITHVIGSSLGGFLGYWLAEEHKLPCLLFNPALGTRNINLEVNRNYNQCPKRIIVLGEQDEIVSPYFTIEFLRPKNIKNTKQEIILNSTMEHRIWEKDFKKYVDYFFSF